jgi:hypothetical protein
MWNRVMFVVMGVFFVGVAQTTRVHGKSAGELSFGSNVFGHWMKGSQFEKKGDFDAAIAEYTNSLVASKSINTFPSDPKQNQLMRECAMSGSQARLDGATAGKKALEGHGRNTQSIEEANIMSHAAFRTTIDLNNTKHPELMSGCP